MADLRSFARYSRMGVTLLELLIVICLVGILSMIAIPSFQRFMQSTRVNTATSLLHSALLFARSESLKRNANVIICRSENASSLGPNCAQGSHSTGWGTGWIIYVDKDRNSAMSQGDEIIHVQNSLFVSSEQGSILPSPHRNAITFRATGQTFGSYIQFSINQAQHRNEAGINRYLCIASGGRARVDVLPCTR